MASKTPAGEFTMGLPNFRLNPDSLNEFFKNMHLLTCTYVCVWLCLHEFMCSTLGLEPSEVRIGHPITWNWSYKALWMLGTHARASEKAVSALTSESFPQPPAHS